MNKKHNPEKINTLKDEIKQKKIKMLYFAISY